MDFLKHNFHFESEGVLLNLMFMIEIKKMEKDGNPSS